MKLEFHHWIAQPEGEGDRFAVEYPSPHDESHVTIQSLRFSSESNCHSDLVEPGVKKERKDLGETWRQGSADTYFIKFCTDWSSHSLTEHQLTF